MKKLTLSTVFIALTFFSNAQRITGETGLLGAMYLKSNVFMYGGSFSLRAKLNDGKSIGAGISGLCENVRKGLRLPVYADIRIPVVKYVDFTVQPGILIYNHSYVISDAFDVHNTGRFYCGVGVTGYQPLKKQSRLFLQLKYNYMTINSKASTRPSQGSYRTDEQIGRGHLISLGTGIAFN